MPPHQDESKPRPEDVECLCKLLATVGGKLDSTTKAEFRDRMKVYFDRMKRLTENTTLESRIRFMVQVSRRRKAGGEAMEVGLTWFWEDGLWAGFYIGRPRGRPRGR